MRPATSSLDHAAPSRCENCGTSLHGRFCARYGQSVAIRSAMPRMPSRTCSSRSTPQRPDFPHAARPDGARSRRPQNYLAGHRARYIAPLRLFVILSVLRPHLRELCVRVLDAYLRDRAPRLRAEGAARFGGRFRASRRMVQVRR